MDELQTPQNGTKSENQQFQADNQEPQAEITTVRDQLQASEHRFSELASQNQHSAECHAPLQTELPEPTRRADQSEATTNEISQHLQEKLALREENEKPVNAHGQQIDRLQKKEAHATVTFNRQKSWRFGV